MQTYKMKPLPSAARQPDGCADAVAVADNFLMLQGAQCSEVIYCSMQTYKISLVRSAALADVANSTYRILLKLKPVQCHV